MITITSTSSRSVKPNCLRRRFMASSQLLALDPVGDVVVAAFVAVGAHRENIVRVGVMLARAAILVWMAPRVHRDVIHVAARFPVIHAGRLMHERVQSLVAG